MEVAARIWKEPVQPEQAQPMRRAYGHPLLSSGLEGGRGGWSRAALREGRHRA